MPSFYNGNWLYLDLTYDEFTSLKNHFNVKSIPYLDSLESMFISNASTRPMKGYYPVGLLSNDVISHIEIQTGPLHHRMFPIVNPITDTIVMTDLQCDVIQKVLDHTNKCLQNYRPVSCCINTPCASGKTVISVKLISIQKLRTFILVPTKIMIGQWLRELRQNNVNSVGSYDGSKSLVDTLDVIPDVLVIVSKHLCNPDLVNILRDNYTVGIFDEIHLFNLQNSSAISMFLLKASPLYSYFLTATHKVNNEVFTGRLITSDHRTQFVTKNILIYNKTSPELHIEQGETILQDGLRNNSIITCLVEHFLTNSIIVLTTSRDHMVFLYNTFVDRLVMSHERVKVVDNDNLNGFQINGLDYYVFLADAKSKNIHTNSDIIRDKERIVMFSTYKLCSTGLNIPNLNMLVTASNNIDSISFMQAVGRIMRPSRYDTKSVVFCKEIEINSYSKELSTNFLSDINSQILTLKRLDWNIVKHDSVHC